MCALRVLCYHHYQSFLDTGKQRSDRHSRVLKDRVKSPNLRVSVACFVRSLVAGQLTQGPVAAAFNFCRGIARVATCQQRPHLATMAVRGGVAAAAPAIKFKVLMLGDSAVGKSCLMDRLVSGDKADMRKQSTMGFDMASYQLAAAGGRQVKLQIVRSRWGVCVQRGRAVACCHCR